MTTKRDPLFPNRPRPLQRLRSRLEQRNSEETSQNEERVINYIRSLSEFSGVEPGVFAATPQAKNYAKKLGVNIERIMDRLR